MKFAHLSDCHIGSWREPALRDASAKAFERAIDESLRRGVDFIIISGDLFDTAQPAMEHLRQAVLSLKRCADARVPVYLIAGSHDYSPSGKTMLDVLEAAGLAINVCRGEEVDGALRLSFTHDQKTGVYLTGMVGRKGSLERQYYEHLDLARLEAHPGPKIFVFHSAITELRSRGFEEVESVPLSRLPKGFLYYAGGHIHVVSKHAVPEYGVIGIPGPLFPNNFQELEQLQHGGFYLFEDGTLEHIPIPLYPVHGITVQSSGKTPAELEEAIQSASAGIPPHAIVALRIEGSIEQGRIADIPWRDLDAHFRSKGALCVLRNTSKLTSPELAPIQVSTTSVEEIEERLIQEHAGQLHVFDKDVEHGVIKNLMHALSQDKGEGETSTRYEERLLAACRALLGEAALEK